MRRKLINLEKTSSVEKRRAHVMRLVVRQLGRQMVSIENSQEEWVRMKRGKASEAFRICEKFKQERLPLPEAELRRRRAWGNATTHEHVLVQTGLLKFQISPTSKALDETIEKPFESRIDELVGLLIGRLNWEDVQIAEREEGERRRAVLVEQRRIDREHRIAQECRLKDDEDRWQRLLQMSSDWSLIQSARKFLHKVTTTEDSFSKEQISWLQSQIDLRDPFGRHRDIRSELK